MNIEVAGAAMESSRFYSTLPSPIGNASPRVLVADDQRSIREALRLVLGRRDYELEFAGHPAEVMDLLQRRPFDLLLMDLNYTRDTTSGREGLELVRWVRQLDSSLPIVVMTAWGSIEVAIEALQCGASDFIQKPWSNEQLAQTVAEQIARGKKIRREERARQYEAQDAVRVQRRLLPASFPTLAGCKVTGETQAARLVTGDYFDIFQLEEGRLALCIGDAAGKGVPAALLMAGVQAVFRATVSGDLRPAEVCARMNQLLSGSIGSERFASFFYGVLDLGSKRLEYCNAGHLPPLLMNGSAKRASLREGGPVLGSLPYASYSAGAIHLSSRDRLLLFTDGLVEATDEDGNEFGEERIAETAAANYPLEPAELQARVLASASEHCSGNFDDDVTLVILGIE